ncbi:unnamed protein product [Clonostachys byssicola]|uniref:Enhancer of mRNA-decapping protein 3 n=1 Tax=Clonostachys byssicola TaxID=160290 RepID=A0A9N9Y9B0_9HYPO|nr:unnamed protein product [Clonostachys byssicola]
MAARFVGLHMRVVLREPAGYQVTGTVRDVEAGSSLTLINVFVAGSNEWSPETKIDASNIADLSEVKVDPQQAYFASAQAPEPVVSTPTQASHPHLDDPAILSVKRPTQPAVATSFPSEGELSPTLLEMLDGSDSPGVLQGIHVNRRPRSQSPAVEVAGHIPLERLHLVEAAAGVELTKPSDSEEPTNNAKSQQRKRRRRPKKQVIPPGQDSDTALEHSPASKPQPSGRGKGWRQTPMLQSTAAFQPFTSLKRLSRGRKGNGDGNGWASEDVTEEMGEFDFENNLAKFDKRTIFDQMRKEDQIDEGDRLVSHNRRPKPGTNGGKNLHYTENVLEIPTAIAKNAGFWNSEADDPHAVNSGERNSGREPRASSLRRNESKRGVSRRSQSRKASQVVIGAQPLSRVNSAVSEMSILVRRSPIVNRRRSGLHTDSNQQRSNRPGLYVISSNRRLETISSLQMLNLENIAANEVGFTEDLMAENSGRGIAEVALRALADPAVKVRFEMAGCEASLDNSTTVILAGNNKSSVRAMAAARHLRNRNIDVVICIVGIERERDLLEDLRRQIDLYRAFGGKVMSKTEFFEYLRKNAASGTRIPISLIIDSLLGLTMSFEELRVGDQATVYELMEWANRNEAFTLSVDIPSGIDPTSGKIAIIDGTPLFVKPRYVVAIGAPKRGLLEAVTPPDDDDETASVAHEDNWRLFVADMGLGSSVWRKAGTKMRRGIEFNGNWVLEMQYRAFGHSSGE